MGKYRLMKKRTEAPVNFRRQTRATSRSNVMRISYVRKAVPLDFSIPPTTLLT